MTDNLCARRVPAPPGFGPSAHGQIRTMTSGEHVHRYTSDEQDLHWGGMSTRAQAVNAVD